MSATKTYLFTLQKQIEDAGDEEARRRLGEEFLKLKDIHERLGILEVRLAGDSDALSRKVSAFLCEPRRDLRNLGTHSLH